MKNAMTSNIEYETKKKQIKELLSEFDVYMRNVCHTSTDEHVSLYEHWCELTSSIDDVLNYTPEQLCDMYKRTARLENDLVANNLKPLTPYRITKESSDHTFVVDDVIWISDNGDINSVQRSGWITPSECSKESLDFECAEAPDYEVFKSGNIETCKQKEQQMELY